MEHNRRNDGTGLDSMGRVREELDERMRWNGIVKSSLEEIGIL
jgi:hypothetical protein